MIFNKKIYVLDQNTFAQDLPQFILEVEDSSSLQNSSNDFLLFNGSIIDKSEIEYRNLMGEQATYFTIIPNDLDESSVDSFWHMNTIVLKESVANEVLSTDQIESFLNILNAVDKWTTSDIAIHTNETINEYLDLNISKPINTLDYTPVNNSFLGGLASGFRSVSVEHEVVYKIKYNSHDKKNMNAVIARFSTKEDEKSFSIVSVGNISNKEELAKFFESKQTEIDDFILSKESIGSIAYNQIEVPLSNITKQIGNDIFMIISYEDNTAISLFENDKLLKIDTIDNFVLIKNYATDEILPSSLKNYKSFAENVKKPYSSKEFKDEFSKIVQSSRNAFLIKTLQKNSGESSEILQTFYYYLLDKKGSYTLSSSKESTQLTSLLMVLETTDIKNLHDKFLTNFFFYVRNSILKSNKEFLELFDEYKEQYKLNISILEEIESSLDMMNGEGNKSGDRVYDINYLTQIKNYMLEKGCLEHINAVNSVLDGLSISEKHFDDVSEDSSKKINYLSKDYQSGETLIVDQTFSENIALQLTYIHKFLTHPFLREEELTNKLDVHLILDLLTMFSIQHIANEENTLTDVKSFIQKNYLTSSINSQQKNEWRFVVTNVLYKLYKLYMEYDKYSKLVTKFDIDSFDTDLYREFNLLLKIDKNSFISKALYNSEDYISMKAAGDKFNKFFINENKRYYIELIDRLFTNKENVIILNLIEMDNEEEIVNSKQFSELKQILCKGRFTQAKGADDVCIEFLQKFKNQKDTKLCKI
ncbi:MAG: hypothetical protein WC170_08000 [Bacteroidales bacterium]|jgi:hypothetical protein